MAHDEPLRAALAAYAETHELTHAQLARKLGFSVTRITKFLNLNKEGRQPEQDVPKIERAVRSLLKHAALKATHRIQHFETSVSQAVRAALSTIRKTNDMGLIHGPAGVGKTCGAEMYYFDNTTDILITVTRWRRTAFDVEAMLFDALETSAWPGNIRRAVWIEQELANSDRLIIVDGAHKLSASGLEYLFDLHDSTNCPIGLIGNPEVLKLVSHNDQLFSRIGSCHPVKFRNDESEIAENLIAALAPEANGDILDEAGRVITKQGHARTLKKQLILTGQIHEGMIKKDWRQAFASASTMLVKPQPPGRARA